MKNKRLAWFLPLALLLAGCNQQDTEALTRIGKNVENRAEVLTGDAKINVASTWNATSESGGVPGHVAVRLRLDKELANATIEVLPLGKGVELRGKVRNLEQRQRAIMLAETTAGVEGVKDSLAESDR